VTPVRITLRGPRSTLDNLAADSVEAYVDVAGLGTGRQEVCVTPVIHVPNVALAPDDPVVPECITVDLERVGTLQMAVSLIVEGGAERGYKLGDLQTSVISATVAGPQPSVARVQRLQADLSLADVRTTMTYTLPLVALDRNGVPVDDVAIDPPEVSVLVPVTKLEDFVELTVSLDWEGEPAPGYWIEDISVDPPSVLVTGSPAVIRDLRGFLMTTPVDISDANESVIRRVGLVLPSGASLVGEPSVLVEVTIAPIQVSAAITRTIELQGLGAGLTATVSPATVDVILAGPAAALNALSADDVRVIVDVFQLGPTADRPYTLTPRAIILPEGVTAKTVQPGTVQVVITVAPTPDPTPSPTPGGRRGPRPA
jgi:YbbR domain-containing protein